MKLLDNESKSPEIVEACAALVADTVPLIMRTIRAEMRGHRSADLSVPQFRALAYVARHPSTSLSEVANHIGLTLPSISKMIDKLVARGLMARHEAPEDRRRIRLELTPDGWTNLQVSRDATRAYLAERLSTLSEADWAVIAQAMNSLRTVFAETDLAQETEEQDDESDSTSALG